MTGLDMLVVDPKKRVYILHALRAHICEVLDSDGNLLDLVIVHV